MNALRCFPAIFTTLVICAITDRMGRRCGMVLPILGSNEIIIIMYIKVYI